MKLGVERLIKMAIELKNNMTEEQAIYRCFMVAIDEQVNMVNFEDEFGDEQSGIVLLCTFPGLHRRHLNQDGSDETVIIVRAFGELQGPQGL